MNTTTYKYSEPEDPPQFGPIPEGDYEFMVLEVNDPYESKAGNIVLPLKLQVGSDRAHIYDNPSCGTDKNGERFDKIAGFLKSCDRVPGIGQAPIWKKLVGARGRVHIKIEVASMGKYAGKELNKVGWYIFARDIKQPATTAPPRQQFTEDEVKRSHAAASKAARDPDLDHAPDDIPF